MTYGLDITSCGLWNVLQCWVTCESIESIMNFIQSRVQVEKGSSSVHTLVSNACVTSVTASMPQILQLSVLWHTKFFYTVFITGWTFLRYYIVRWYPTPQNRGCLLWRLFKCECCTSAEKLLTKFKCLCCSLNTHCKECCTKFVIRIYIVITK